MKSSFIFDSYAFSPKSLKISFTYRMIHGIESYLFTENLILPKLPSENLTSSALKKTLDSLHLILGISYWKLFCPSVVEIPHISLSRDEAKFWNTIYSTGLGEFYYKNNLDGNKILRFPYSDIEAPGAIRINSKDRALVGIGGGKDSVVTAQLLKKESKKFDGFVVLTQKSYPVVEKVIDILGIRALKIERQIDSQLFKLNKRTDVYNGHIPISAIYAWIGVLAAIIYGYKDVIVSNEGSANEGNVEYLGKIINHQWSKSEEFENLFQSYVGQYIATNITYKSFLRKYSELEIMKKFTVYPEFFDVISSCNRNFSINKSSVSDKWCGVCSKCLFVFIMFSAYIDRSKLISIFGRNLFENKELLPLFMQLIGLEGSKPFDCVGTAKETRTAMTLALHSGQFNNTYIMNYFSTL